MNIKTLAKNISFNKATGIITKLGYDILNTQTNGNDTIFITRHNEIKYNEVTGDLTIRDFEMAKVV